VVVFIGLLFIINSMAGFIWDYPLKVFPTPFPEDSYFGGYVNGHQIGLFGVTIAMLLVIYAFFRFTPIGLAMRAAAQNPVSSRLVGVRVNWMIGLGWGLAAAVGAIAGMMVAPIVYLDPTMMTGILLYGFAAALLGGIENPLGAVVGGFLVGVLENLAGAFLIGTELKLTVALIIIVGVLTIKPSGLFGKTLVTRV
jgi:branched-chain amino acid transport system permease protein